VDLHSHSTASDGALSPSAVVEAAHAAGLSALALTDHDTMGGIAAAEAMGARLGVRIVPGSELSALDEDREVHILGLHVRPSEAFEARLAAFRALRVVRSERIVAVLRGLGIDVTQEQVLAHAGGGAVGRPHVARALVAAGAVRDLREAFDRYLGAGRPAYVAKELPSVADAIALIHDAGGLAFFAHPGREGTRERVERLVRLGLDGLELRHPSHSPDDMARMQAFTDQYRLARTGGSDWHGAVDGPRLLGAMQVPAEWLEEQDRRVAERRRAG
jgi:hypothetical protein